MTAGPGRTLSAIGTGLASSAAEHKGGNSTLQIGLLDPIARMNADAALFEIGAA